LISKVGTYETERKFVQNLSHVTKANRSLGRNDINVRIILKCISGNHFVGMKSGFRSFRMGAISGSCEYGNLPSIN
jgi:hypothetical protein